MVTDAVFGALFGALQAVLSAVPAFTAPFGLDKQSGGMSLHDTAYNAGHYLALVDQWIDVEMLVDTLAVALASLAVWGAVALALFVYRLIPAKAT